MIWRWGGGERDGGEVMKGERDSKGENMVGRVYGGGE